MTRQRALALNDQQLRWLTRASLSIPQDQRDAFLRAVASRLNGEPSDMALLEAINLAYDALPTKEAMS